MALTSWFNDVTLIEHEVDPGFYAVFARIMVGKLGGPPDPHNAAYVQLSLGSEVDETYGRLLTSSGAVKYSSPISLMVVSEPNEEGDRIRLVARGSGAITSETRLTIIALDEARPTVMLGEPSDAVGVGYQHYSREVFVPGLRSEGTE